jgi:uncharacterized protein (DUF2164 family)
VAGIEFDKETRDRLARDIARHLKAELDLDVAPFEALELLDFLSERLGPHYYNQGLADAQAVVKARADDVVEAIYGLEKAAKP